MPFLGGVIVGAFLAGEAARWIGRCKGLMLAGFAAGAVGFLLLAGVGEATATP